MEYELKRGTLLSNRYLIEKVIGRLGSAIIYSGIEEKHNKQVIIKELFIEEMMRRDAEKTSEISLENEIDRERMETFANDFLKEARFIKIFNDNPILDYVGDCFKENNTAYIIMEYLEGIPLLNYLMENGRIDGKEAFRKMQPVFSNLRRAHDAGIIHGNISPDNIIVRPDHSFKLIGYSAVKGLIDHRYTPIEQYDMGGKEGPWTDIYALSATIYSCITGMIPQESVARICSDEVKKPSELGIRLNPNLERILWKGMAVKWEERYQDIEPMQKDIEEVLTEVFKMLRCTGIHYSATGASGYSYRVGDKEIFSIAYSIWPGQLRARLSGFGRTLQCNYDREITLVRGIVRVVVDEDDKNIGFYRCENLSEFRIVCGAKDAIVEREIDDWKIYQNQEEVASISLLPKENRVRFEENGFDMEPCFAVTIKENVDRTLYPFILAIPVLGFF